ncbi:uncharacterized protein LOC110828893 isoform X3 [Zootermopsis nevadensis]|uniref:uncharacterized protein LOC110828893 isoform X3 n=1 Tax=Zootermopsis nevadensis TaxID=136037 RepID=UPI000B8EDDE5|nr:uncharacterized protein LOC110828893 isoform X3 [Zootermopsis nevadensis]
MVFVKTNGVMVGVTKTSNPTKSQFFTWAVWLVSAIGGNTSVGIPVPAAGTMRRTESVSSVSSMSVASTSVAPGQNGVDQPVSNHSATHDEAGILQDFDVASVGSATSGLSTGTLQNIREQVAISLERMKELEEQVKLIPVLQVQLSVLKEEKRKMMLQLRLEEAERNKRNIANDSSAVDGPVSGEGTKDSGGDSPIRVRSQSCCEGLDRNYPHTPSLKSNRSSLRDVGVTCSVVTREVGVSPQRPRLRNAMTSTRTALRRLSFSGVKIEEISPDDTHILPALVRPLSHVQTKLFKHSPVNTINIEPLLKTAITKTSATNTELLKDQVYSDVEMDHSINRAIQMYKRTFKTTIHGENTRDIGVQIETAPKIAPVLMIVERRDIAVQSEYYHCRQEAFSQTEDLPQRLVDIGVSAKPRCVETAIEVRPKTRDFGVSGSNVNDVICDKCKVKKRSIGVGHQDFNNLLPKENVSVSLSNIGVLQDKPLEYLSPTTKKETVCRSVGCGTPSNNVVSQGTSTDDLCMGRSRDFGVNTTKRKLVDAAVGDASRHKNSGSGVFVCDKCDVTIQNVAKNMLTQSSDSMNPSQNVAIVVTSPTTNTLKTSPSATISRIPRLSSVRGAIFTTVSTSPTSQVAGNGKRRIQRQDTYTKLQPSPECRRRAATPTHGENRYETSQPCPAERLLAMQASGSQKWEDKCMADRGQDLSALEAEEARGESSEGETHAIMDNSLFQPIQHDTRNKTEPSKEMKAALKVLNDYLRKSAISSVPLHLKNASNIVQQEWFKISSTASANPLDVEDYLDCFEEMSGTLLEHVVNMVDMSGNTAMHYAVSHGNFDVVSILLDSKVCNINRPNAAGYTCVMLVSLAQVRSHTHQQVIRHLFQLADVNVRAKQHGQTALMLAVSHGRLDMVRLLVETGADMNIQDEDGSTSLMCAAEHGHTEIVKYLLSQPDCDASITDCDDSSALNIAMEAGNRDIGVLLYAHEHFSRGSSPYTTLRQRRSKSATPTKQAGTPPSPSPVREKVPRHEQAM